MPNHRSARSLRALRFAAAAFAAGCALAAQGLAHAAYPENPVRFIVPFAPGGAADGVSRLIGGGLGAQLGQPLVVDNRAGAGGVVGITAVAHAAPDGYTLLMGSVTMASAPMLYKKLAFDPIKDFAPVIIVGRSPYVLVVAPDFPAKTLREFIALAKAHPGKYNFGSAGTGSSIHLAGELFKSTAHIDIVHVPYKGAGLATTALLAGQVQFMFGSLMEMTPLIQAGKLRALAVTSDTRTAYAPDVPTMKEAGLPGYEITGWYGLFVPAGTPAPVVARLHDAAASALASPEMKTQMRQYKLDPAGGSAADAGRLLRDEVARWAEVIKAAHIEAN
jgi:tripartite-type tricarboxylate transporter receptor subunit TctC